MFLLPGTYNSVELTKITRLFNVGDNRTFVVPVSEITETRTDTKELCPYVEIEYYNIGGWRDFFLLRIYEDTVKYILYTNDEIH